MNIKPKIIPIFQNGGVPQWYLDRYGNRTSLLNWDLNKRYNYSNLNLNTNDHRNAGNLDTVYNKNMAYIGTPGAISSDIQAFYDSDGNGMSALDFVNFYNQNAAKIRNHWALDLTYNAKTAGDHNRLFKRMFLSRSNLSMSPGSSYNIGYLDNLENIEGSSTWLRRMDLYENEFDPNNPDNDRIHEITLKDGTKAKVYKKANGDIALLPTEEVKQPNPLLVGLNLQQNPLSQNSVIAQLKFDKEPFINKLQAGFNKLAPDLLDVLRLAGNMHNNERVYNESMKAIIPNLQLSFHTYRQVVGDEATKQGYYRRAAQGQSQAAKPFTSDADKQMAYLMEAKRIGDELRAQGDLADNQRIRETSAESAAHADANIERDTHVANNNLTELIKARAARHQLTALKYSADWTNLDLFLLGRLARLELKKAEEKNLNRLLAMLDMQEDLLGNTTTLSDLKYQREKAYNNYMSNTDESKSEQLKKIFNEINIKYQRALILAQKDAIAKSRLYAKSGTKLTYKDNTDKYLYKVSRDIVEHFRKMSRMTDDSRVRTLPKTIKLNSSPKKKLQLGGTAPFTIYRPLGATGESQFTNTTETGGSSSKSSSSSKDTAAKDKLDMIKELFKSVQGLPIDVSTVYQKMAGVLNKAKALGEEMTTDDIAAMYLSSMNELARLKYSQKAYEDARSVAVGNDALSETAVGANGELILLNLETGEVKFGTMSELKKSEGKLNALTNELALTMRAHSPNLAFNDRIFDIVNNGIGMSKIANHIKSLAGTIGSMETKIEGITQVESNKVKAGLKELAEAPDGYYKISTDTKDSSSNVKAALEYIYGALPKNYKTILEMNSGGQGKKLIASFLTSQTSGFIKEDITPLTGKASDKEKDKPGNITPAIALSMGLGERESFTIADKTSDGLQISAVSLPILDKNHNPMATGTLLLVGSGDYAGQLQLNSATMGGVKISPEGLNNILISEGRIHAAELPVDKQALLYGIIKPDLNFLKNIEKADLQVRAAGITNRDNLTPEQINTINNIYSLNGLPIIYTMGSNGPVLTSEYRRFAMMKATATETAFEEDLSFNDGVIEASNDDRSRFESIMKEVTGNQKYSLDNGISIPGIGRISGTDLYKGIIYIPMVDSHISALAGTGYSASPEEYNKIDALDQQAEFIRNKGLLIQGSINK